jgi:hypothetical protein
MKKLLLALTFSTIGIFTANAQFQAGVQLGLNKIGPGDYNIDKISVLDLGIRVGGVASEKVSWQASFHYGLPSQVKSEGKNFGNIKYNYIALQARANIFLVGANDEEFGFHIPLGVTLSFGSFKEDGIDGEDGFNPFVPTLDIGLGINYILDSDIGIFGELTYGLPATLTAGGNDN